MDISSLQLMASYNVWATKKLTQSLIKVSDLDFHANNKLFFKSISGTLNHLLVGEHYIWYPRFAENLSPKLSLDTILETDKAKLLANLENKSHRWIDFIRNLDKPTLNSRLQYTSTKGQAINVPYGATLLHVFNHGTHHRGQVTAAMTNLGYECPELDLIYMLTEK